MQHRAKFVTGDAFEGTFLLKSKYINRLSLLLETTNIDGDDNGFEMHCLHRHPPIGIGHHLALAAGATCAIAGVPTRVTAPLRLGHRAKDMNQKYLLVLALAAGLVAHLVRREPVVRAHLPPPEGVRIDLNAPRVEVTGEPLAGDVAADPLILEVLRRLVLHPINLAVDDVVHHGVVGDVERGSHPWLLLEGRSKSLALTTLWPPPRTNAHALESRGRLETTTVEGQGDSGSTRQR